jgi:hypothetical protein
MRSLPAFLMAFIVTVIISGALMIGCGGSSTTVGGAGNAAATNTGASNTGATNTASNNNVCRADGALCVSAEQCCNKSCYGGAGNPLAPGQTFPDYRCQKPPSGVRWCVEEPSAGKPCNTNGGPECCDPNRSCFRINPNSTAGTCM